MIYMKTFAMSLYSHTRTHTHTHARTHAHATHTRTYTHRFWIEYFLCQTLCFRWNNYYYKICTKKKQFKHYLKCVWIPLNYSTFKEKFFFCWIQLKFNPYIRRFQTIDHFSIFVSTMFIRGKDRLNLDMVVCSWALIYFR